MRKFLFCVLIMLVSAGLFARETGQSAPSEKAYNILDIGHAKGIIIYDKGFYSDGWRYLEAAPIQTEFKAEWGVYKQDVPGTLPNIGSGKKTLNSS